MKTKDDLIQAMASWGDIRSGGNQVPDIVAIEEDNGAICQTIDGILNKLSHEFMRNRGLGRSVRRSWYCTNLDQYLDDFESAVADLEFPTREQSLYVAEVQEFLTKVKRIYDAVEAQDEWEDEQEEWVGACQAAKEWNRYAVENGYAQIPMPPKPTRDGLRHRSKQGHQSKVSLAPALRGALAVAIGSRAFPEYCPPRRWALIDGKPWDARSSRDWLKLAGWICIPAFIIQVIAYRIIAPELFPF